MISFCTRRSTWWCTLAAGVSYAAVAQAQDAPATTPAADTQGDIVVTGFRASQRSAVDAKRKSDVILDAVAQDDVGRLPDLNIVEASRRIAGVSVVGGADSTKNRDIYQRATIRGLDPRYNLVTIDGIPLASSDWVYRGARLEMLPASLVSRIEAIKSVTAQYDPHALGGQINIVSKSAFDRGCVKTLFRGRVFRDVGRLVDGPFRGRTRPPAGFSAASLAR